MGRSRGNARKKKSRLTERSLTAAIEVAAPRPAAPVANDADETEPEVFVASILSLLRDEPATIDLPAAYNDPARVFATPSVPTRDYVLGLTVCPVCHNQQLYYQRRDLLAAGYDFRCSVCQQMLHVTHE